MIIDATPAPRDCVDCSGAGFVTLDDCPRNCRASQDPRGEGCFHRSRRCWTCGGTGRSRRVIREAANG